MQKCDFNKVAFYKEARRNRGAGGMQPPQIFAKVDLLQIEND